jgi:preprotein translocase subunit SecA
VRTYVPADSVEEQWDLPALQNLLAKDWQMELDLTGMVEKSDSITDEDILDKVIAAAHAAFDAKVSEVGQENFTQFERIVLLQNIDSHWREHLSALDYLRQGIHLRGFAQKQPKQEYKREAFELFGQLLDVVKNDVTRILMNVKIQSNEQIDAATQEMEQRAESISNVTYTAPTEDGGVESTLDEESRNKNQVLASSSANPYANARIGRNDPCPCGSGKKYKNCHGKLS